MKLTTWTLKQLFEAMQNDLQMCQTIDEKINVETICKREMLQFVASLNRKLTPGEQSILDYIRS